MSRDAKAVYEALQDACTQRREVFPVCTVDNYRGLVDKKNEFNGIGIITSRMGFTYEGCIRHGQLESSGTMTWVNGHTVTSEFVGGAANGKATLSWPSGDVYEGDVRNGVRHGQGTLRYASGGSYTGSWVRGKRQGKGTMRYPDRSVYEGDWASDEQHGSGILWYQNGDCYEGQWERGRQHGRGEMAWKHGGERFVEAYDGEWVDGLPSGTGTLTYIKHRAEPAADEALAGTTPSQFAPPTSAILNVYQGSLVGGVREGHGTFYYADGSFYKGGWAGGKKQGRGMFVNAVGAAFYGEFHNDKSTDVVDFQDLASGQVPEVYVSDLCSIMDGSSDQVNATIKALLLRFNSSFRALMSAYAAKRDDTAFVVTAANWWKHRIPGQISLPQFLRLLNDAHLLDGGVNIATVLRCVVDCVNSEGKMASNTLKVGLGDADRKETIERIYQLQYSLNYRQLAESLVRLAPLVCQGEKFRTLGEKLNSMVTEYLKAPLHTEPLCPVSRKHHAELQEVVEPLTHLYKGALSADSPFLTVRQFLVICKAFCEAHRLSVTHTAKELFPYCKYAQNGKVLLPPGFNKPQSELSESLFVQGCGPHGELLVSGLCAELELSIVDFIEAVTVLALKVCRRKGPSLIDVIKKEILMV